MWCGHSWAPCNDLSSNVLGAQELTMTFTQHIHAPLRINPFHFEQIITRSQKTNSSIPVEMLWTFMFHNWLTVMMRHPGVSSKARTKWTQGISTGGSESYMQRSLEQLAIKDKGLTKSWQLWNGGSSSIAHTSSTFCSHKTKKDSFSLIVISTETKIMITKKFIFIRHLTGRTCTSTAAQGEEKPEGTMGHRAWCGSASTQLFPNISMSWVSTPGRDKTVLKRPHLLKWSKRICCFAYFELQIAYSLHHCLLFSNLFLLYDFSLTSYRPGSHWFQFNVKTSL